MADPKATRRGSPGPSLSLWSRSSLCSRPAVATMTTSGTGGGNELQKVGKGEGKLNLVAWAGYVEDGSTDPAVDWVTPFEKQTGCQVSVKVAGTSDEMVQLMRTGQYDGVSASGNASAAAGRGRRRRPGQRRPGAQLQDGVRRPQGPALQHVRRHPLRDPARAWGEPAGLEDRRRQAGAEVVERDPRPQGGGQVQGQDQRLRRPDLHRRRGGLPEDASARPRDREPVRAERGAVRRRDRPAQAAAARTSASTGTTR